MNSRQKMVIIIIIIIITIIIIIIAVLQLGFESAITETISSHLFKLILLSSQIVNTGLFVFYYCYCKELN